MGATRGTADYTGQYAIPSPYHSSPHSENRLMSETGWRGPGSAPSMRSNGSYHSPLIDGAISPGVAGFGVPLHPDDPRRRSMDSAVQSSHHSFNALASSRPTSLQSQPRDHMFYDPQSNSMQQQIMSVSLPPGAASPVHMVSPSQTGSSSDRWNLDRIGGSTSSASPPPGSKAGEAYSQVEATPTPAPPLYHE